MAKGIECDQIKRIQLDSLSRTILTAVKSFYEDPDNLSRFEAWKKSEDGQAYCSRLEATGS